MKVVKKTYIRDDEKTNLSSQFVSIDHAINSSWSKVTPSWPLKNIIAVNPLSGFEDLHFEEGLKKAQVYFQQKNLPAEMKDVNRETMKWLQVFFDKGQATIHMPNRNLGFLKSTLLLLRFDKRVHNNEQKKINWLRHLPENAEVIIADCLRLMEIGEGEQEEFCTLMLTTLPGWSSYIKYLTEWPDNDDSTCPHTIKQSEYLAFRIVLTYLLWPKGSALLLWHKRAINEVNVKLTYDKLIKNEKAYQDKIISNIQNANLDKRRVISEAQLVFCIDVRSEPFRRAIERQGNYETFGFAGFFGVPANIENFITGDSFSSCPVLIKPKLTVVEKPKSTNDSYKIKNNILTYIKKIYQSTKYTFTTPFSLVEAMGLGSGLWMVVRCFLPRVAANIMSKLTDKKLHKYEMVPNLDSICFDEKLNYASGILKMIGLTENFAPFVLICGHGSSTQNNAYRSSLDCGACGGRSGTPNARIMASILNDDAVRKGLANQGIKIPQSTIFIAAEHNTTSDEFELCHVNSELADSLGIQKLKTDLEKAKKENSFWRACEMGIKTKKNKAYKVTEKCSQDWAEIRPEWGLSRNACFVVGPRSLTKNLNMQGRSFLHSYDWEKDINGTSLTAILTAPMVVAHWISSQYLFSTLDNVAFGGGSKVTKNITGKIGVMQGNASDLMCGLPLQSVFKSDDVPYHTPMRLSVIVRAPRNSIQRIIDQNSILQKLFGNEWVILICIDPNKSQSFKLMGGMKWVKI